MVDKDTLPETHVAPESRSLEKEIPIGNHHFFGAMLVFGRVTILYPFYKTCDILPVFV